MKTSNFNFKKINNILLNFAEEFGKINTNHFSGKMQLLFVDFNDKQIRFLRIFTDRRVYFAG